MSFWYSFSLKILLVVALHNLAQSIPLPIQSRDVLLRNPIYGEYFEGDMRFPVGFDPKNGITGMSYRWPNKVVTYTISSDFERSEVEVVLSALDEISEKTCVQFARRTTEADYVSIERGLENSGCWSFVGHQGGKQVLNLEPPPGSHCIWHGIVAHEMLHAIGFLHEQSRADRDDYVTIAWDNIPPELQFNFDKYNNSLTNDFGLSYDYKSLMHYDPYAFAIDPFKPTIIPKVSTTIGQNVGLSELDAKKVGKMYDCEPIQEYI